MIRIIRENIDFDNDFDDLDFGEDKWIVKVPKECIVRATLLTEIEYYKYQKNIPDIRYDYWWLMPDNSLHGSVCYVDEYGDVCNSYQSIDTYNCIRPVLILNLSSSDLKTEDEFEFGDHLFTLISKDLAICNEDIGSGCLSENGVVNYEKSDVKKVIDDWFNKAYAEYEG